MIKKFLTRKHKDKPGSATSGSAAVEFAMVLPVLMALVAGALNYGLMGLQMSTLISAARGGAEYAKSNPTDSSLQTNAGRSLHSPQVRPRHSSAAALIATLFWRAARNPAPPALRIRIRAQLRRIRA
ncbi:MAG: pilus assembly protein [Alphaproteobacteria bacterium]|nr:MAG: pilus assembly protein [Alphaproteobacteria bacterium]